MYIYFRHPSMDKVINSFKLDAAVAETKIVNPPTAPRRSTQFTTRVYDLCQRFAAGLIQIPQFLNEVSHLIVLDRKSEKKMVTPLIQQFE